MRELDVLLLAYLEQCFAGAGAREQAAFEALLGLEDPALMDLLLGRSRPAGELADVVAGILRADRHR
ncbi:MAG TPA: succinate dehydrogenase assembly factor 2 [Gammaproteobacteria bacterium]|nr:succinate dehydrogenase assembly factor 2 [Gammaproteobacteria bacterium]